ncbi:MAG: hypothetical protein QM608_15945 [Caulobacter sp.]
MTTKGIRERLTAAMRDRRLMCFERRFEEGWATGYIVGIGPAFLMLQVVSSEIRFNGFSCYRLADVKNLQPALNPEFVEAALAKRGDATPETPAVALDSVGDILATAGRLFPLIAVHPEIADPGACYIGAIISVEGGVAWMQDIGPDAIWEDEPIARQLESLTRMDFGGDYETALILVGGAPPSPINAEQLPLRLVSDNG